jgi:hypothetical protein
LRNPPVSAPLNPVSSRLYVLSSDQDKGASIGLVLGPASRVLLRFSYCLHDRLDTRSGLIAYSRTATKKNRRQTCCLVQSKTALTKESRSNYATIEHRRPHNKHTGTFTLQRFESTHSETSDHSCGEEMSLWTHKPKFWIRGKTDSHVMRVP